MPYRAAQPLRALADDPAIALRPGSPAADKATAVQHARMAGHVGLADSDTPHQIGHVPLAFVQGANDTQPSRRGQQSKGSAAISKTLSTNSPAIYLKIIISM